MGIVSLIAGLDEVGGIGYKNQLLCHLPADLQHFKTQTLGKPIIMGRKTFQSIGKPLPGRLNIVLSRNSLDIKGVTLCHSLNEALELVVDSPEIMIIGGSNLYEQSFEIAEQLYITRIHNVFSADVFFPKIEDCHWECVSQIERRQDSNNAFDMTFYKYHRKNKAL